MMKRRMSEERPCQRCGKSLGADAAAHVCAADPELRATKADTPSGIAAAAAVSPTPSANGKKPGPTSGRVTSQMSAELPAAPPPAPTSAVAALQAKLALAGEKKDVSQDKVLEVVEDDGFDPLIGSILGEHYRIIERLGRGGMGTVYLVTHIQLKKKFAAKILNAETARREDAVARFQQEAVSASKLDHENIINIVHFGRAEDDTPYFIMEFLRGEALNQILAKGPLGLDDVLRVVVPMCHALAAAHGAGIVHRDLKPENVFVSRRSGGRHLIKLLDFGISKIKLSHVEDKRITQTGDVLGSPLYMSPEASRGDADVDGRADIYAIGVLLYEMTTGRAPFSADNYLQVLYKHISEEPVAPRVQNPDLPAELEAVILKCLAKDPAARYQRVEELEAALVAAVPGVDLDAPVSAAASPVLTSIDMPIPGAPADAGSSPSAARARGTPPPMAGVAAVSSSGSRPRPRPPDPPSVPALVLPPPRTRGSRLGLIAGFVGTLGILAFGAYAVYQGRSQQVEIVTATRAPEAPPARAEPPPPRPAAAAPVALPRAELTVESTPPGAVVTLDGAEVGTTPLTMTVAPDGRERQLRVELAGFRPESRQVVLDRSHSVELLLKKLPRERPDPPPARPLDIKEGR
jgi:serine/threonine protein kinase